MINSLSTSAQTLQDQWIDCNKTGCKLLDPYYSDGATMTWDGSCSDGKANGFGKIIKYQKGVYESTFEGEYVNGIREGKGKFTHKDGTVREGTFVNGQMTGKGTMTAEDGQKYEGEFINYRMHGQGITYFPNGSKFEGFFVSDRPYTGKFTNYDGKITYIQGGKQVEKIKESLSNYHPKLNEIVTEYFDANWKRCEAKNATYYRRVTYEGENKPKGKVKDYYIMGQIQSEFTCLFLDYDDEGKNFHEGEGVWYFKSGKVEQKKFYFNNKLNGKNIFWYENGQKASEGNYEYGYLNGYYYQWYQTGNLKRKAFYEKSVLSDNKYAEFDENGLGGIVYNEYFIKNKTDWERKDEFVESNIDIVNNNVNINNKNNNTIARGTYIPFDQNGNYSIETIIDRVSIPANVGSGLSFGFKDWDNYYQFIISGNGSYKIYGEFEGVYVTIKDWTTSIYINPDNGTHRNLLKVLKISDNFIFSINGQVVASEPSKTLRGNYSGAIVGGKGNIIIESLIIRELIENSSVGNNNENTQKTTADEGWLGNGSGFFINEKGYIATNYHVVKDATEIQVEYFQNGIKKSHKAKVIVSDKQNDLSIIQITDPTFKSLPKLPYSFSTNTNDVGTGVFTLGYPMALGIMGEEVKFTDGKISAKTGYQGDITVYQISVAVQPGNSGGPLFDNNGNIVGIVSSGLSKEITENVNYAIKSSYLKNLIDVLPERISLPNDATISTKSLVEQIKIISDFIPLIKIK
jgi:S1-C subfamily serine protease